MTTISYDGEQLGALALDFYAAAEALATEAPAVLTEIGEAIKDDAKRIAAQNGSTSIPDTIRGDMHGWHEYRIRAGGENVAIAGLWELGAKGSRPVSDTTWSHPVWGHRDRWVEQTKYPFLRPALAINRVTMTAKLSTLWDRALIPYDLRPSPDV